MSYYGSYYGGLGCGFGSFGGLGYGHGCGYGCGYGRGYGYGSFRRLTGGCGFGGHGYGCGSGFGEPGYGFDYRSYGYGCCRPSCSGEYGISGWARSTSHLGQLCLSPELMTKFLKKWLLSRSHQGICWEIQTYGAAITTLTQKYQDILVAMKALFLIIVSFRVVEDLVCAKVTKSLRITCLLTDRDVAATPAFLQHTTGHLLLLTTPTTEGIKTLWDSRGQTHRYSPSLSNQLITPDTMSYYGSYYGGLGYGHGCGCGSFRRLGYGCGYGGYGYGSGFGGYGYGSGFGGYGYGSGFGGYGYGCYRPSCCGGYGISGFF
ncbi:uncharacterized protein ACOB7L_022836 [Callospermophilus lateralis]